MTDIGCAGILVEDTFCGPMPELPREGMLLAIDSMPVKAGGCAANVALDLARQGFSVEVLGCVGRDDSGRALLSGLAQQGVGCAPIVFTDDFPTSRTVILLVAGQDRRYIHIFGANRAFTAAHIRREWLASLKLFYLGGLFAMPGVSAEELREALIFCRERGITTVVDVVVPQSWNATEELTTLLPYIDYFLPNDDEAKLITGLSDPLDQLRFFAARGAHTVIITQGKAGAIAGHGNRFWRCGTYQAQVVDPSGSGDAFAAGVIAAVRRGRDLPDILRYGSALGCSATRAVGTTDGVFTTAEADAFVAAHPLTVTEGGL